MRRARGAREHADAVGSCVGEDFGDGAVLGAGSTQDEER